MKFFIDTANLEQIQEAYDLGVLDGVPTNPSLMAKDGIKGTENQCEHYIKICNGILKLSTIVIAIFVIIASILILVIFLAIIFLIFFIFF